MFFLDTIAPQVPLIVGSVFLSLGANSVIHFYKFRARSKRVKGIVKAIERYTSYQREGGHNRAQTYYRPIVEYQYNDETRTTTGASMNEIRHKLKQAVTVMLNISEDGKQVQAKVEDSMDIGISSIFALMGLGALGVYIIGVGGSWITTLIVASTFVGIGYTLSNMMLNFQGGNIISQEEEWKPKEDSVLIETKADYIKTVSSHGFWGNVIAFGTMFAGAGIMYAGYLDLPEKTQQLIQNDFGAFWDQMTNGELSSSSTDSLMIFGIGAFFFLVSLRSIYYVRKKYGGLSRM
ncbi:MAG: hypothetical protein ACRBDL_08585 [Alphaproteobacteria bacterium]